MTGTSPSQRIAPSPRPGSTCSSPASASFTRFYEEQQLARDEMLQRLAEEKEAQLMKECPFRPTINKFQSGRRHEGSQRDTFSRLSRDKKDMYRQLEEERARQHEKELEECSFRPQTNKSFASTQRREERARTPIQLHTEAAQRQLQLRKKQAQEEEGRKEWFQPRIDPMSRATAEAEPRPPLHERIEHLQRHKQVLIHKIRMQELQKEAATFKPQINQTSNEIVQLQQQSASNTSEATSCSPYEEQVVQRSRTQAKLQEEDGLRHTRECTFRPELSQKTKQIIQQHAAFKSQDFNERQMLFARRSKSKLHTAAQKVIDQEETTFEPELAPTTVLLTQAKRDTESIQEKMERLAVRDKEKLEDLKRKVEEEYYSQFTFHPKLSKVSRVLASTGDAGDVTRAKTGHVTEEIRQELEEEFRRHCTFKPAILNTGGRDSLNNSGMSTAPDFTEKERRLAEARREQLYEELKDCTFQPRVKRKVPNFGQCEVQVPGMAKYLDRRMQARQMEEERKAREEEVFKAKVIAKSGHRYTVPQPFKLHTAYHSLTKKEKMEARLKAKAQKDCTFAPCTNAKAAYDILRKYILQDDPESDDDEDFMSGQWAYTPAIASTRPPPWRGASEIEVEDFEDTDPSDVHPAHDLL